MENMSKTLVLRKSIFNPKFLKMNYHFIFFCALFSILNFQNLFSVEARKSTRNTGNLGIFAEGIKKFSAEYFKILTKTQNGNFISSPLSTAMVLALATHGADNNTRQQLSNVLNFPIQDSKFEYIFYSLIKIFNNSQNVDWRFANGVLVDNKIQIKNTELLKFSTIFDSEIKSASFEDECVLAAEIDEWYWRKTQGKIIEFENADELHEGELIGLSAAYFNGKCLPSIETQKGYFEFSNGEVNEIETVCSTLKLKYNYILGNQVLSYKLPFENKNFRNKYSMYIFFPVDGTNLKVIYDNLDRIDFKNLFPHPASCQKICIPKFNITSEFVLTPYLKEMKITDMFGELAVFSNFESEGHVKMADVIQKISVGIDSNPHSNCDYKNSEQILLLISN
ncbi:hypothetical protein PV327_011137 [Microctonus hyperodae]|uniref:Serpin domain-containing protein n=1 Tax=Microctonus hyperodae TaxID=165561 RepID=A0AA39EYY4_MICHY|nr:hypothetical protein PV327_011137 [Microctonus hyperodae]